MKKIVFTVALCLVGLVGFSQARVELGLKGGLNFANLKSGDSFDTESKTGYHAGIYGMIKVANIGIQPEVLYSRKGATFKDFTGMAGEEFDNDLVYLDIPVMLKFYLPLGFNLQAGPQFGLLMSADGKTGDYDNDGEPDDLSKDSYKDADVSAALGLGWDAPFGLRFNARYILGFNDINDTGYDGYDQKNRMFQLSVGYSLIKLGK